MRCSGRVTGKRGVCLPSSVFISSQPIRRTGLARLATAVFEYRKGRWWADGKRLDEIRPDEVVGRNRPYEPVEIIHPGGRRVI